MPEFNVLPNVSKCFQGHLEVLPNTESTQNARLRHHLKIYISLVSVILQEPKTQFALTSENSDTHPDAGKGSLVLIDAGGHLDSGGAAGSSNKLVWG